MKKIIIFIFLLVIIIIYLFKKNIEFFDNNKSVKQLCDRLTVIGTNKRSYVIVDEIIMLDYGNDGLNFVIFTLDNDKIILNNIKSFDIGCCRNEIIKMNKFIDHIHLNNNILIVIVSKGDAFKLFSNKDDIVAQSGINKLKTLGTTTDIFRDNDNYIFIISSSNNLIYETISPEPVYFPYINITSDECYKNPDNILYPNKYVIFDDKSYDIDNLTKCAIEANIRGLNKFSIFNDKCIPMSDNDYYEKLKYMDKSNECINNTGSNTSITTYKFNTLCNNKKFNPNIGVTLFESDHFKGEKIVLTEGVFQYENRINIKSINIPANYFLFIIDGTDIIPFYGPLKTNVNNIKNYDTLIVQVHRNNNTVICGKYKEYDICQTIGPGMTTLYPKLFIKILTVNIGSNKKVSLYSDVNATDLIETFMQNSLNKLMTVKYPRIVRAVVIDNGS